jgi:hypothetical protein
MSARALTARAALLAALAGCAPAPAATMADAAADADDPGVDCTITFLPPTTEDTVDAIDRFRIDLTSVVVLGDRGAQGQLAPGDVGVVTITSSAADVPVGDIPPALYSEIDVVLGDASGTTPAIELDVRPSSGPPLAITVHDSLALAARCEQGTQVLIDDVRLVVDIPIAGAIEAARAQRLPAPDAAGTIRIDEHSAPEAVTAFRAALRASAHAECDPGEI